MAKIRRLPPELVGKIAAGEVIERPASVAKELIENAIDSGAGQIAIELSAGGKSRIRVRDDGQGMGREDALLALERHATSKIGSFDDLVHVGSLGFRGEALASMGAVAHIELESAEDPGDGHRVRFEIGQAPEIEPISRSRGTAVEVSSLFYNVPARRKFLKSDSAELRRILEVVQGYALSRPTIRFEVKHEDRVLLDTLPAGEGEEGARRRIGQIFGSSLEENLSPFFLEERTASIWGFVGNQSTVRGRRYFIFINRRLVRDRAVMSSFYRAVREVWRGEDFPALFLFVDLPAEEVDVNVHPQKSEVRFRDQRVLHLIFKAIGKGLEAALGEGAAPLRKAEGFSSVSLAWEGTGGRYSSAGGFGDLPFEVRERLPPGESPGKLAEAAYAPLSRRPVPLSGRDGVERPFRLLGQYKGTIILLEGPDGLYLVDQHVAHERILYERLRADLAGDEAKSQRLLEPVLLELSSAEAMRLGDWSDELAACGFEVGMLSAETIALTSVPAVLGSAEAERVLETLAKGGAGGRGATDNLRQDVLDALAASMACRSAIKMHEPLSADKMESLVSELFSTGQPYNCPHGRPTILKMNDADLERRFGRR
jgi:DNA mismatch repair protein MutL